MRLDPAMRAARTIFLVSILLSNVGCSEGTDRLVLPFDLSPDLSPGASAKPKSVTKSVTPPVLVADCDDLPDLSPEELARPPFSLLSLEKSTPKEGTLPPKYRVLPEVTMPDAVAERVTAIDDAYARRAGKHLTVTSGTRDATRQAKAMYKMLHLGGDPVRLYRNKEAAREVKQAYEAGRAAGKSPDDVVTSMYNVLQAQIARGVYISAHLRAGAVDIRSRDMSAADRKAFLSATSEVGGIRLLEENTPPHFHLQIE